MGFGRLTSFDRNSIPLQILKQITSITIIIPIWSRVVHWSQPGHNGLKTGAEPGFRAKLDPSDLGPNTTHCGPNPSQRVTKKSSDPIQLNPLICFGKLLLLLSLLLLWELFWKKLRASGLLEQHENTPVMTMHC